MTGRVRGRLNGVQGSRSLRHYFRQSAGKGFYMIQEKKLRGKGKGFTLVGSYALFMADYNKFCNMLFRWRTRERRLSVVGWKMTRGAIRVYGGERR